MNARALSVFGYTLLVFGLGTGGFGFMIDNDDLMRVGVLVSVPGATALVAGLLRGQANVSDDQLAAAHSAGYVLALDHVARGLLDQPTAPTGGGIGDSRIADVRHLRAPRNDNGRAAG